MLTIITVIAVLVIGAFQPLILKRDGLARIPVEVDK